MVNISQAQIDDRHSHGRSHMISPVPRLTTLGKASKLKSREIWDLVPIRVGGGPTRVDILYWIDLEFIYFQKCLDLIDSKLVSPFAHILSYSDIRADSISLSSL